MSSASGATGTNASTGSQAQRATPPTQQSNDPGGSSASSGQNGASGTNTPAGDNNDGGSITNPEAKRYADEAAQYRTQVRELNAQLKKFQDAQLSDQQKLERDFTDSQAKSLELEAKVQRLALENAGLRLAPTLGIADPAAALALVQAEHGADIKMGADGTPENLQDLLKTVLKNHPVLAAGQQGRQAPAPNSGGATNPGRQAGNGGLTIEIIKAMPMRERMARMDEIDAWQKAQQQ